MLLAAADGLQAHPELAALAVNLTQNARVAEVRGPGAAAVRSAGMAAQFLPCCA